jgi:hypothetical protein
VLTTVAAIAVAAVSASAFAQSGQILGKVTDEQGQAVAGAVVEVTVPSERGTKLTAKTNENGDYIIPRVPGGGYIVIVSKPGMGTARTQGMLGVSGLATVNVTLARSTVADEGRCARTTDPQTIDGRVVEAFAVNPALTRLLQWLVAANLHIPGCADVAASTVAGWSREYLDALVDDIAALSTFLQQVQEFETQEPVAFNESRANAAARRAGKHKRGDDSRTTIRLHGHSLSLFDVEQVFRGNNTVKRGAVLHADIGVLIGDDLTRKPVFVADGRQQGRVRGTVHFEIGRKLLDAISPRPTADADALLWYRAVSAYLLCSGRLHEAPAHLEKARRVFADRAWFLVDSAYLHEKLASASVQAAVRQMRDDRMTVFVDSRRVELGRAERFLRQALERAPDDSNARLRLGRTLGEMGRHDEAATELRTARKGERDRQRLYLIELFLGREEQTLGRRNEARRHFENAAALYPNAQSPRLALSLLARQAGDRKTALLLLQQVNAPSATSVDASDPFWFYHEHHADDADTLMEQMRTMGRGPALIPNP